jgi:hypothetical protein
MHLRSGWSKLKRRGKMSSSSGSSGDGGGVESERQTLVVYRGGSVGSCDGTEGWTLCLYET